MVRASQEANRRTSARRLRAAMRKLPAAKVDAILVSRPEDVSYVSGFSGEDSFLLVGGGWAVLITDGRYAERARAECGAIDVQVRTKSVAEAVAVGLVGRRVRRLGYQAPHATVAFERTLAEKLPTRRLKPLKDTIESLRVVKDDGEIRAIRRSIRVAERAFREVTARGAKAWAGRSERDLAAELDYRMRLHGADGSAFETIVAAGAHASQPHYRPGGTRIRPGQGVLIDWGARVGGYCSDLTRVVFVGRIPPELAEIYEVVRRAQAAGIAAVRSGVSGRTVDAAARAVMNEAGYGKQFVHGLGHGIGRQIHEAPGLARTVKTRLRAGMVVTIEPGIYLPGVGGIRIEDDVLVTPDGPRRLTSLPRRVAAMVL